MIHVCFGLYDKTGRYSKFTGTAMLSLFENTNAEVTAHILHDNTLTQDNRDKFIYLSGQYNQRVKFYNVEALCNDKLAEIKQRFPNVETSRYSIATFYRFFIPQLISNDLDKIIYLDSDLIVNLDVAELWRIELGDKPLAAVPETEADAFAYKRWTAAQKYLIREQLIGFEEYFNAGVLLMNLKRFQNAEQRLPDGIKFYVEHPQCVAFDQDIMNYLFAKECIRLPARFDSFVSNKRLLGETKRADREIYHYVGESLQLNVNDPFNRLWLSYFMKTPWFDEEAVGRLYAGFRQVHVGLKQSLVNLSAILSGKTRTFFAAPKDLDGLRQFFSIRDDEKIIPADGQDAFQKLLDTMRKAHGKRVFFIMVPYFPVQILTEAGFLPGKDFVNGLEFLFDVQGGSLNSYELIKAM